MMTEVKNVFNKYAVFDGRSSRREYWFFFLFDMLVILLFWIITFCVASAGGYNSYSAAGIVGVIFVIYELAAFIPRLAVTWRRLHDVNRSGAYYFICLIPAVGGIILLITLAEQSYYGTNSYGPPPDSTNFDDGNIQPAPPLPSQEQYRVDRDVTETVLNVHEPSVQIKIVCNAGAIAGQVFSSGDTLCIGRSKSACNVLFPENTKGISRTHCCLKINQGQVILVDLGSSYGTFLENGKKLPPNEPVKINDNTRFYLADRNTCFTAYIEIR